VSIFTYVFVFPAKAEIHSTQPQRITQTALVKQTSRAYNPVNQKAFGDDFGFDIVDED
jgi:hypothetical protein